ncbi:piwi domain-containing protein [Ditylenchus destructor]|nr:piwi domain-containing protein [Ditylenchus destructor]
MSQRSGGNRAQGQSRGGGGSASVVLKNHDNRGPLPVVQVSDAPNRQFQGTLGSMIKLVVNYFKMNLKYKDGQEINRYDVRVFHVATRRNGEEIRKEIISRSMLRPIFWKFVERNPGIFPAPSKLIYDDSHILYAWDVLRPEEIVLTEEMEIDGQAPKQYRLEVKPTLPVKKIPVDINVLSLVLSQFARCTINLPRRYPVSCEKDRIFIWAPEQYKPLDLNFYLHMLRGIQNVAKPSAEKKQALANYDVVHSSFYKVNIELIQFYAFAKTGQEMNAEQLAQLSSFSMNRVQRRELRSLLSGLILRSTIAHDVTRTYRFWDVSDRHANNATFMHTVYDNAGNQVSSVQKTVAQYYRDRYEYVLKYPNMPLIQVAPAQKNIFIPMELLLVHDKPQRLRNKLPDDAQGLTNAFTSRLPRDRFWDIHDMMEDIDVQSDPFLRDARVEVNPKFLEIEGRVLPQPNCKFTARNPRDQLAQKPENTPQKKVAFSLISINNAINFNDDTVIESFDNLIADCSERGMKVAMPGGNRYVERDQYRFDPQHRQTLGDYILKRKQKAKEACGNDVEFVLICIVPTASDMIYNAFKTECEIYHGVMSQFMLKKTFLKLKDRPQLQNSVTRNIFLKLNAKTGGVNNYIPPTFHGWNKFTNAQEPTLFIGIDVTHPPPGDTEFPSISAVVGNIDVKATQYTASVRTQFSRTEGIDIDVMAEMCDERIRSFRDANRGLLPKHIILFRDGVSESQFDQVMKFEAEGLKNACVKLGFKPTVTVLIVQKRHSTRFYAPQVDNREQHPGVNKGNPPPGTVVDRYITTADPNLKEFYLCAHRGMLGTSRPVHYFVLFDNWKLSADDIQVCSYSLCHLFARAAMPVSLPAPVFYAHLCCYRARRHFSDQRDAQDRPSGNDAFQRMVRVHDHIKPRMYFC